MSEGFKDKDLLYSCELLYSDRSFTGNDIISYFKLKNNQIHMQLFRISKKNNRLLRYSSNSTTYYSIKP